ncbi:MerR family transcriptional regulator [Mycolicibacterium sphagni]|uniref:MerR family transcriptional regulator n=1 Tax=Mycolicibacterium sphagni TaxID=1786 RepID=A0ABX2JZA4_9MYCO|nr:MerR family transcriptional regulator [Mycolicibacterium sphagni]NTY62149.1 MerR family transcriptional regulator [Mycolicibacterium sphagni]
MTEQQLSFDDLDAGTFTAASEVADTTRGWRGPAACAVAGITYRQLDYWARTDLVPPSIATAAGSGSVRLYSFHDLLVLRVVKRLLDAGISLVNIRTAVAALRDRGVKDLAGLTLVSDGVGIYECTTANEVVDLLAGGQGVFGIAVGASLPGLREDIRSFPAEAVKGGRQNDMHDELAKRRGRVA